MANANHPLSAKISTILSNIPTDLEVDAGLREIPVGLSGCIHGIWVYRGSECSWSYQEGGPDTYPGAVINRIILREIEIAAGTV